MLVELRVRQLGVVDDISLVFGPGMAAITGETGAGKTMLTEAIRLLTGGRAEPQAVRSGATEATIEGRFVTGETEVVLARVVPAEGRSRAYADGRMVPVSALAELGEGLVDLHGQHGHQALLSGTAQRAGLDTFGAVDVEALRQARVAVTAIDKRLDDLGGDSRARAREIDLLRFQLEELEGAHLTDGEEDDRLRAEEDLLAGAVEHRLAAQRSHQLLAGDGAASERLAEAIKALAGREPLADLYQRMVGIASELDDVSLELAGRADTLSDDPERLAEVQERRALLKQLQRKYGPSLEEVVSFRGETAIRLADMERHDEVVADLEAERVAVAAALEAVESRVGDQRRKAAPRLAAIIESHLHDLALPKARFAIQVDGRAGDDVRFELCANPGMPLLPVAKAASGGELARTMLAMRLALLSSGNGPDGADTLIFDEVDAGIGGEAAIAVGRALSALGRGGQSAGQVFVVTHLAQVAAFADEQILVEKSQDEASTVAIVRKLGKGDRETELARMLSGRPDSESGRAHARELLEAGRSGVVDLTTVAGEVDGAVSKKRRRAPSVRD